MPSEKYTQAYKEALAQARSSVVLLETIEVTSSIASTEVKDIEVCFCIDDTGSMAGFISTVRAIVTDLADDLKNTFRTVKFSLVRFKDENDTETLLGLTSNIVSFQNAVDNLAASGGGDSAENGYGAIVQGCSDSAWSNNFGTRRYMLLITDVSSHERGATEAGALASLADNNVKFLLGSSGSSDYNYDDLISETNGTQINFTGQPQEGVRNDIADAIRQAYVIDPNLEPIYMIQARQPYDLRLENGELVTFEPTAFRFTLPGQNDQGLRDLNITIDNVDERIGKWIEAASAYDAPSLIRYRPYLSTDLETPQMDPPLSLVVSDIKRTAFEVSGRASIADIVNLRYLRTLYLRRRFPSLGNT